MAETAFRLKSAVWSSIEYTVPSGGKTAGDMYAVGSIIGVCSETLAQALTGVLVYRADNIMLPKVSGAITAGAKLYYDSAQFKVTTEPSGNTLVGRARAAAATADTQVAADLEGSVAG